MTTSSDPVLWHRLQFAFTASYHYLFPQLTMGLAPLIVLWKWRAIRSGDARYAEAARFWTRIFGLTFAVGVVTGIPLEFQFGTDWAGFSRYAGGVVGQTLAMEGMFAFFLESALVGTLVFGEARLSRRAHFAVSVGVCAGAWLSAYFILATNAFMQHPVAFAIAPDGSLQLADLGGYLMNSWAWSMLAHNQAAALVSGAFVVAGTGAYYQLRGVHRWQAHVYLRWGVTLGLIASVIVAFPTGDHQAKLVARNQEVALAAMEGRFNSGPMAPITLIGQPNVVERRLDNPIALPGVLSFLAYGTFHADVRGLAAFPEDTWPTSIEPLYYAFHIMAGLGTFFIALMGLATLDSWRGRLEARRALLWTLMLALPFPFIANAAGWMTAEMGRQPWLVYGLYRTRDGASDVVSAGNTIFTLIGFCGLYLVLGLLYLYLVGRDVARGPAHDVGASGELAVIE